MMRKAAFVAGTAMAGILVVSELVRGSAVMSPRSARLVPVSLWRASRAEPVMRLQQQVQNSRLSPHNGLVGRAQRQPPIAGLVCRHDAASVAADRARREEARALLRAINAAQGRAAQATRQYVPLAKLPGLPPVPDGFELRLYTDGNGYIASLKDSRDPCHYGVFSDEDGRLYEMSPQVPLIAS